MPATFDILTRRRLPSEDQINLWVHAGTGSDAAAGTEAEPLASTEEALGRIPSLLWGRSAVVRYLSGHDETIARPLFFPPVVGGGQVDDVAFDGVDPAYDYVRNQITLLGAVDTVEDVNGTITLADATSQLTVITDLAKAWTPGEHVGRSVINPGNIAEHGKIWANTATQIFLTSVGMSDGGVRIVERAASLRVGDGAAFVSSGLLMSASTASVSIIGINLIGAGAGPAIDITGPGKVALLLSEIRGGFQCRDGAGSISLDACYLNGGSLGINAGTVAIRQSLLAGMVANFHAVTGQYDIFGCRAQGCGPLGHGGTSTPHGGFRIDQCWIADGTSHGISYGGGNRARVTNTRIDSCAGDAINAAGTGKLDVINVAGSGSTGYGAWVDDGANVTAAALTVAGALGQVRLGGAGGATHTWADAPQVNTARLCRFGA